MSKEDIKLLIKNEYENGTSISTLAEKYNQKVGTIKSWISRGKWIKKKENSATIRKKSATKKLNQSKMVANEKEIKIQQDILNGKSKQEIMSEYGISERTYSRKTKSVRELRLSKTEKYLDSIIEMVYPDLEDLLTSTEKVKRNLFIRTVKEVSNDVINFKRVDDYNKTFDIIKNMSSEIMKTGKIVNTNSLMDIEQQITNEDIQKERLEIERSKLNDKVKETENESKSLDLLNKLVGDKNATNS